MYGPDDVLPVVRSEEERRDPHPILAEFMERRVGKTFARDEVREEVIPVYMGLIKQIDDQLGRLFRFMQERGLLDTTMIVFTSDHGDYLGDHWMGEKDLFHEPSVRIPLIVCRSLGRSGQRARHGVRRAGRVDRPGADLPRRRWAPTRRSSRTGSRAARSCPSCAAQAPAQWRRFAISEYDYSLQPVAAKLGVEPRDARLFMVADKRWKLIHALGFRPMLYDLETDPNEFRDLGADPALRGRAAPADGGARRLGAAPVAAHDRLGAADAATGAASRSAAAS